MNAMSPSPTAARRAVSPYARRLARERNVPLDALVGSGPRGRVVAADVLGYEPSDAEVPAGAGNVALQTSVPSAFSMSIALDELNRLNEKASELGLSFELVDVALRALRCALEAERPDAGPFLIALETDGRQVMLEPETSLSIGSLRKARLDAMDRGSADENASALISLQLLSSDRVRAVSMPVLPGRVMRLRVLAEEKAELATALLSVLPDEFEEQAAMTLLETFGEMLEQPLRLLA